MRSRIVGLTVLASMLTITLFGVPLAAAVVKYTIAYERIDLERVADTAALAVAADLVRDEPSSDPPPAPADTNVAVYEPHEGRRLAGVGPANQDAQVRHALGGVVDAGSSDGHLVVAIPVTHDGDVIGAVRAARPRTAAYSQIVLAWTLMLALATLAIGTVWLLARRQAGRLAQPLEEISESARRLGHGEFRIRHLPVSVPEIDDVGLALNNAAERLDDMLARERAFSADVSHQLRTPLTGLRLRLEAALDTAGQDLRAAIRAGITEADRLQSTIDELMELTRDSKRPPGSSLDVAELLEEIEQASAARLAAQGRRLVTAVDDRTPSCTASAAAVRQVLAVLLDNATVHGAGTVTVRVRDASAALAIDVSDEGRPLTIPEARLFARRSSSATGHGIGLALARRLAEAEGGRLHLTQADPPTFTVLLPATYPASDHGAGQPATRSLSP